MKLAPYGSLIEVAIEPKSDLKRAKIESVLAELSNEDPSLSTSIDQELGHLILGGASEEHLDNAITRIGKLAGLDFDVGAPQVAYRETLIASSTIDHTHKQLTGRAGELARVIIQFEPAQAGTEFVFENKIPDDSVPDVFVSAVKLGIERQRLTGLLVGFPVVETKASLIGGAYHDEYLSSFTFQSAASAAFKQLKKNGHVVLIEPIMKLAIVSPETFVGPLIGDIVSRRGTVIEQHVEAGSVTLEAEAPLGLMFGYVNSLRALSNGHASYTMTFDRYCRVPSNVNEDDPRFPPAVGMPA